MSEVNMDTLQDWQKYVSIIFDEMKVKEGLVYAKNDECNVIWFIDVGTISNDFASFERTIDETATTNDKAYVC